MSRKSVKPVAKLDPHNIRARVFNQVSALLTQLEERDTDHVTMKERIAALVAISRIEQIYFMLRLKEQPANEQSGSTVRKYASAFENAGGRRKTGTGATEPEPDDWFEHTDRDDDIPDPSS
jgi:hypothetical protein